jgi:hypothetical protein
MNKKIIVFLCEGCIKMLKEYNPYVLNGEQVLIDDMFIIKTPLEQCENIESNLDIGNYTSIVIKPTMNDNFYNNDGYNLLIRLAVKKALSDGLNVYLKVWVDEYCREEGIADYCKIVNVECIHDLFYGVCQEIVIDDGVDQYTIAHYEKDDNECYIMDDILVFIEEEN